MSFRERYLGCPQTFGIEQELGISESELLAVEETLQLRLPAALREFYLTLGAWELNVAHNRLLAPKELRLVDKHLVFYEDSEGDAVWGISRDNLRGENPIVSQGVKERRRYDWYEEELECASFLVLMTFWQTLVGGLGFASVATVEGEFDELKPGWQSRGQNGPMSIYTKGAAVLGVLYDPEEDLTSLHAGAMNPEELERVHDEYEELPWELITGEDDEDDPV